MSIKFNENELQEKAAQLQNLVRHMDESHEAVAKAIKDLDVSWMGGAYERLKTEMEKADTQYSYSKTRYDSLSKKLADVAGIYIETTTKTGGISETLPTSGIFNTK